VFVPAGGFLFYKVRLVLLAAAAKALIIKATNQQNIILATLEILIFNI